MDAPGHISGFFAIFWGVLFIILSVDGSINGGERPPPGNPFGILSPNSLIRSPRSLKWIIWKMICDLFSAFIPGFLAVAR